MLSHGGIKRFFSGVSKGRVPNVVDQGKRFHQIDVQPKLGRHGARNLRHFDGVSQSITKMVRESPSKHLRFGFEAAKGAGVNYAVAVALKIIAIGMLGLRNSASAGFFDPHGVIGEHGGSLAFTAEGAEQRRDVRKILRGLNVPSMTIGKSTFRGHAIYHPGRIIADV
jgi:hypothetical protein